MVGQDHMAEREEDREACVGGTPPPEAKAVGRTHVTNTQTGENEMWDAMATELKETLAELEAVMQEE